MRLSINIWIHFSNKIFTVKYQMNDLIKIHSCFSLDKISNPRMHSSRMRTVRTSGRLSQRGVSAPGQGGECVCSQGGVVSQHALRQTPPPGQTDTCKNITFATSLRTVNMAHCCSKFKELEINPCFTKYWGRFLPSATKLWQSNVFTGICHSV